MKKASLNVNQYTRLSIIAHDYQYTLLNKHDCQSIHSAAQTSLLDSASDSNDSYPLLKSIPLDADSSAFSVAAAICWTKEPA